MGRSRVQRRAVVAGSSFVLVVLVVLASVLQRNRYIRSVLLFEGGLGRSTPGVSRVFLVAVFEG